MFTAIFYIVIAGQMQITRLPVPDAQACQTAIRELSPVLKPLHAECKAKKAKS